MLNINGFYYYNLNIEFDKLFALNILESLSFSLLVSYYMVIWWSNLCDYFTVFFIP